MVVVHHALAHGRGEERQLGALDEGAHFVFGARPAHALADDDQWAFGCLQRVQRLVDILRQRLRARRVGDGGGLMDLVLLDLAQDDVVGHVQIACAGAAIDRVAHRHFHVERDAVDVLDGVGELAERGGDVDLAFLLEGAHAILICGRCAADQDHRPAVLLGVGQSGEAVHHAGS